MVESFKIPPSWRVIDLHRQLPESYLEAAWLNDYFFSGNRNVPLLEQEEVPDGAEEALREFFTEKEQPPYYKWVWFCSDPESWQNGAGQQGFARASYGGVLVGTPEPTLLDWFIMCTS